MNLFWNVFVKVLKVIGYKCKIYYMGIEYFLVDDKLEFFGFRIIYEDIVVL